MTIYRFEKLISFIPAYSTIFIIIVTYSKLAKSKASSAKYITLLIMVFPLLLVLSYLYDGLLVNYTEWQQLILSAPAYWIFNWVHIKWQEKTFQSDKTPKI